MTALSIKTAPLFLVYILYPVVMIITRHIDIGVTRNWIDLIWMVLAVVALFVLFMRPNKKYKFSMIILVLFFFVALVFFVFFKWGSVWYGQYFELIPYLMELKPVVYLCVSILWVFAFGKMKSSAFVRYGVGLGIIVIFDFFLESFLAGKMALPRISGERNYDACLLLISYIMTLASSNINSRYFKYFIFIGLMLTFSRTALGAAVIITLFASDIRIRLKIMAVIFVSFFIVGSFILRELPLNSLESMDRYWMWSSVINLFLNYPREALTGFPVGVPLPISVPSAMEWLWGSQSNAWGVTGVFPFHMHSFWLRLALTWGLPLTIMILIAIGYMILLKNKVARGLSLLLLIEGLTMGVFYLGNIGVPLFIAFFSNLRMAPYVTKKVVFIDKTKT